jgi:hypothetical protein
VPPNFVLLDATLPDVARLVAAMVLARDAVESRSWLHPQEPTGEEWWADVLADPRARKRERRTDLAVKQAFYRLADEKREIILVACSKCEWKAAYQRAELLGAHGRGQAPCANFVKNSKVWALAKVRLINPASGPSHQNQTSRVR